MTMQKHFVTFESPGTFVHETTTKPIEKWDVTVASKMAHDVVERHNAIPFAFFFTTRSRTNKQLDSKIIKISPRYFLGGEVKTIEDIEAEHDPKNDILISNMRCNHWPKIVINTNSWRVVQPLLDGDTVLDWKRKAKQ